MAQNSQSTSAVYLRKVSMILFIGAGIFVLIIVVTTAIFFFISAFLNRPYSELEKVVPPQPAIMRTESVTNSMVCATYVQSKEDPDKAVQGSWTDDRTHTSSLKACLNWKEKEIRVNETCRAQRAGAIITVYIPKSKHTFTMPELNFGEEFVTRNDCP